MRQKFTGYPQTDWGLSSNSKDHEVAIKRWEIAIVIVFHYLN